MGTFGSYEGNMSIPEEKKEAFSRQVIKLLNYGGMMQLEKVSMYGHDMGLLKPVEIYPGGKVHFHYNYFEDASWETAGYDADRAYFYSGKIGGNEYCDVVTAVHFLYEVNDDAIGYTEINGDVIHDTVYVGWLNHLLGTAYSLKKRFRLWDYMEKYALERVDDYDDPESKNVMDFIPYGLWYVAGGLEFTDLMYITRGTESLTEQEPEPNSYPADVYQCRKTIKRFLKAKTGKDAVEQIFKLLGMNREERARTDNAELTELA